jgi:hypothetical protein
MEVKTINEALINGLNEYKTALTQYSEVVFNHKEAEDVWSIGQMYEHLVASAGWFFLKNIKYCLEQRNGQLGGEMNENGQKLFHYNGFPPIKIKVPGGGPQPVAQPIGNYSGAIDKIIDQIVAQESAVENDPGQYKTSHPAFLWLSAKEWLQSFEMHTRHHFRQKAELEGFANKA